MKDLKEKAEEYLPKNENGKYSRNEVISAMVDFAQSLQKESKTDVGEVDNILQHEYLIDMYGLYIHGCGVDEEVGLLFGEWLKTKQGKSYLEAHLQTLKLQTKEEKVDADCPECEDYIVNERVTFEECCDTCGTEIEWHGEEQQKESGASQTVTDDEIEDYLEGEEETDFTYWDMIDIAKWMRDKLTNKE